MRKTHASARPGRDSEEKSIEKKQLRGAAAVAACLGGERDR